MKSKMSLTIALGLVITINSFCQNIPIMFVPKFVSDHRISQFTSGSTSKYVKLKKKLPNLTASFIYTRAEINMLLSKIGTAEGLRVYFAVYNDCIGNSLPSTVNKNKIILLFSPGNENSKSSPEQYFFIDENDNKELVYEIADTNCIHQWLNNYTSDAIQNILRTTLVPNDQDNIDPNVPGKYFDTKSIFYPGDFLSEAITLEETFPHILKTGPNVDIAYFKFTICAFDNIGQIPSDGTGHKWRNRLVLNIDYMYKTSLQKKEFYLEDLVNFDERNTQTLRNRHNFSEEQIEKMPKKEKLKLLFVGLDNGQLCPTNCPR